MANQHLNEKKDRVVTIDRTRLLAKLKENRELHAKIYDEAVEGYWNDVRAQLRELSDAAHMLFESDTLRKDFDYHELVEDLADLRKPVNHLKAYDEAIDIFTWDEVEKVELTVGEFVKFVRDEWTWKHAFIVSNASYSKTASDLR